MASRTTRSSTHAGLGKCHSAIGRAFSVEDGLLALRWAAIVRPCGYRLRFSHTFIEADEAILIYQRPRKRALATIFLGVHWVWIVDGTGQATPHEDVAAALTFLVELSDEERRILLAPQTPEWLWQFRPTSPTRGAWLRKVCGARSKDLGPIVERIRGWGRRWLGRA